MIRRAPDPRRVVLVLLSATAIAALFLIQSRDRSPGPLSPTHAAVSELRGGDACDRCHGDAGAPSAAACGGCHDTVRDQVTAGAGFHGVVPAGIRDACGSCHPEHFGAEVPLVSRRAFARAGFAGRGAYSHEGTRFELTGRHEELECSACHPNSAAVFLSPGEKRFLGRSGACTECHEDPHAGSFGLRCGSCHGQERAFETAPSFRHPGAFPLRGAHGRAACESCHSPGTDRAIAVAGASPGGARSCGDCHENPHGPGLLASPLGARDCGGCHGTIAFAPAGSALPDHAATGFPLHGAHGRIGCSACHEGLRFARPDPACASCHAADAARAGEPDHTVRGFPLTCGTCHGAASFEGAVFGHDRFPLTGAHGRAACAGCHEPASGTPPARECLGCHEEDRRNARPDHVTTGLPRECGECHGTETFSGARLDHAGLPDLESRCVDCHVGEYRRTTDPAHGPAGYPLDCARCHGTGSFEGAEFAHGATFPLTGAHRNAACAQCHEGGRFEGTPAACAACHLEDYRDTIDPDHPAAGISATCSDCHGTTTFRGAAYRHTPRFPLSGGHADLSCLSCHETGSYRETASDCLSCHRNDYRRARRPDHADLGYPQDCRPCHGTSSFRPARFTHRFPLDRGKHRRLSCTDCHTHPNAFGSFSCTDCHEHERRRMTRKHREVRRYASSSQACVRCHPTGDEHEDEDD